MSRSVARLRPNGHAGQGVRRTRRRLRTALDCDHKKLCSQESRPLQAPGLKTLRHPSDQGVEASGEIFRAAWADPGIPAHRCLDGLMT